MPSIPHESGPEEGVHFGAFVHKLFRGGALVEIMGLAKRQQHLFAETGILLLGNMNREELFEFKRVVLLGRQGGEVKLRLHEVWLESLDATFVRPRGRRLCFLAHSFNRKINKYGSLSFLL